ncbi:hypothetical protein GLOIN_2v1556241 [Rhizophagus irregularis DAOM 181602=DAOM 197198]|uniref:Uncharacterized protein n=1 Tax=Rhizophagus irregularis (strain DAOM 181602 / DAOM 197198 / MUCL 43194) TaxID=747089 RepID=U9SWC8_RHIID|nr:hypothetical protein GLOIN_2v1556241 [Rhizophagus irregularis DAOM 181602=DAOM 197198]
MVIVKSSSILFPLLRKDSQLRLRDYSGVENIHQNNNVDLIEVDSINNGIGNGVDNNTIVIILHDMIIPTCPVVTPPRRPSIRTVLATRIISP